jgi:hypothetical protein
MTPFGQATGSTSPRTRVSTFGFAAGPQLITALSEGRGYGEAGGEVFFLRANQRVPHPPLRGPPSPASGRRLLSIDISPSDQNVQTPRPG